jgi:hypothetical protein
MQSQLPISPREATRVKGILEIFLLLISPLTITLVRAVSFLSFQKTNGHGQLFGIDSFIEGNGT